MQRIHRLTVGTTLAALIASGSAFGAVTAASASETPAQRTSSFISVNPMSCVVAGNTAVLEHRLKLRPTPRMGYLNTLRITTNSATPVSNPEGRPRYFVVRDSSGSVLRIGTGRISLYVTEMKPVTVEAVWKSGISCIMNVQLLANG